MKIGIVTLFHSNYSALSEFVLPNWNSYCEKHNYSLSYYIGSYGEGAIGFHKIRYLLDLFEKQVLDLALVLDLDILITNQDKKIEDFIKGMDNYDYFVTKDINGINNGSFIIRNTEWSRSFLKFILSHSKILSNEQDVLKNNEGKLIGEKLKILDHPSLNDYLHDIYPQYKNIPFPNNWNEDSFVLHLPGTKLEQRLQIFKEILNKKDGQKGV